MTTYDIITFDPRDTISFVKALDKLAQAMQGCDPAPQKWEQLEFDFGEEHAVQKQG